MTIIKAKACLIILYLGHIRQNESDYVKREIIIKTPWVNLMTANWWQLTQEQQNTVSPSCMQSVEIYIYIQMIRFLQYCYSDNKISIKS